MLRMNAYYEDLRMKIVEALRRGMTKSEAARSFVLRGEPLLGQTLRQAG
jgi:hypothetical protein